MTLRETIAELEKKLDCEKKGREFDKESYQRSIANYQNAIEKHKKNKDAFIDDMDMIRERLRTGNKTFDKNEFKTIYGKEFYQEAEDRLFIEEKDKKYLYERLKEIEEKNEILIKTINVLTK